LTDNVVADIVSVGMTGMDAGLINPVDTGFGMTMLDVMYSEMTVNLMIMWMVWILNYWMMMD
jgi:hypothetical protein